ncbi:DUF4288 domain-containing protein [Mucilaginibacter angelicae]|uniref:DUF4288 domain-containing protein n=1 Tax=Mucilaginibacter angelicae TaxID=869718 RepID=A0ABV6LDD8_9SPHI
MKEIYGLKDWVLDKKISNTKRFAVVKIVLLYPEQDLFNNLKPKERVKAINKNFRDNYEKLIALELFESFEISGPKKRPQSVIAKLKYNRLKNVAMLDYVASIWIQSIEHAEPLIREKVLPDKYFCVKMTVVIEEEGILPKKQQIEKRFVLIKAKSGDDAYEQLEKRGHEYTRPYLNPHGRFVRWRIDSYDDCYETDIESPVDLDNPVGVEVYSKLSTRKNKDKTTWDGKF